jgi:hypothetical protein
MDESIDNDSLEHAKPVERERSHRSDHLMCSTPLWGLAGFAGCVYFAWVSFMHVRRGDYDWPHDWWTAATYLVWIVLLAGLGLETRCFRERMFFGALVLNFLIGCGLTVWHAALPDDVRLARMGTGILWALAAALSLTTLGGSGKRHNT